MTLVSRIFVLSVDFVESCCLWKIAYILTDTFPFICLRAWNSRFEFHLSCFIELSRIEWFMESGPILQTSYSIFQLTEMRVPPWSTTDPTKAVYWAIRRVIRFNIDFLYEGGFFLRPFCMAYFICQLQKPFRECLIVEILDCRSWSFRRFCSSFFSNDNSTDLMNCAFLIQASI